MNHFSTIVTEHLQVIHDLEREYGVIQSAGDLILSTFKQGGKILICGNGGSAADSQHIAAEFVVRYGKNRAALPAIALTTDTSILTAQANDFAFETLFSRQIEALGQAGDCLIAMSTSGNSTNVIKAVNIAKSKGMTTIAMTGQNGEKLARLANQAIIVPSSTTARIQEVHMLIAHWWCHLADKNSEEFTGHET